MKERFVEELEDHGEWVLTRTIKEVWHKKEELDEEAFMSERTGIKIKIEKLPLSDKCSVCGGCFSDTDSD
tara:strand:- start:262 stop:471 length:210 start_codon:yes stop_codon:yes gene_type:complete